MDKLFNDKINDVITNKIIYNNVHDRNDYVITDSYNNSDNNNQYHNHNQ